MSEITENIGNLKDGINDATDKANTTVDIINKVSNLGAYAEIYNSENSSSEEKEYASIMIMETIFSFGDSLPEIYGGAILGVGSAEYVTDAKNIILKSTYIRKLYEEGLAADEAGDVERAQICQAMINNIDESYEAYKIAIQERIAQNFPTSKTEWDKFYESYQESNDPDEIYKNVTDIFDDGLSAASDALGFMDETTPHGQLAKEMSEAFFKGIENWEDGAEIIADGVEKFCDDWSTGMKFIGNMITNAFTKKAKASATNASTKRADPFILDLDGDGFNVETKENGTNFDLDKNDFAEKINWTSKDGFLCLDLNKNGNIDNGGEIFGDQTM